MPTSEAGDTDTDTDGDSDSDTDGDTDSDTESETEAQGPVDFVLTNLSGSDRYLDWSSMGVDLPGCRVLDGEDGWVTCRFQQPWCTANCDEVGQGDNCCMDCGYFPAVKLLADGESLFFHWDGRLQEPDWDYCSECECYDDSATAPGVYHVVWGTYDGYECFEEECEADSDSIIMNAAPAGTYLDHFTEMEVVYEGTSLVTSIY